MAVRTKNSRPSRERVRIRKGSLKIGEDLYLSAGGRWVDYRHAKVFTSQDAATKFAERHGVSDYGLF